MSVSVRGTQTGRTRTHTVGMSVSVRMSGFCPCPSWSGSRAAAWRNFNEAGDAKFLSRRRSLAELAKAGICDPVVVSGGKHLQVRWTAPGGLLRMLVVPGTPSDWRAAENTRHDLRRILRADGMLVAPEPRPVRQSSRIELIERRLAEVERRLGIGRS